MQAAAITDDNGLAPGTRLGRYRLVRRLAIGGMAELYLARAEGLAGFTKLVALKRILPSLASSGDFVGMFLDEARLAATIQHANVAQVYDIGRTEHGLYFTMEYVHGEDVRTLLNAAMRDGGEFPLNLALTIAIGAAAGLHAAHELVDERGVLVGLVHRDVSPSNVLVSYAGGVKLIDFGVAKAAGRQTETRAGTLKGKLAYMSPEQCAGRPVDRRSDVFALGVVLYEMTTGTRLFTGDADYELMKRIVEDDAPPPSRRKPGYPPELEAIVLRALARDPAKRYPSAQALQLDLERFARSHALAISTTELSVYLRDLLPERSVGPGATGAPPRLARMATGTPLCEAPTEGAAAPSDATSAMIDGAGTGADAARARIGLVRPDDDDEPAIELAAVSRVSAVATVRPRRGRVIAAVVAGAVVIVMGIVLSIGGGSQVTGAARIAPRPVAPAVAPPVIAAPPAPAAPAMPAVAPTPAPAMPAPAPVAIPAAAAVRPARLPAVAAPPRKRAPAPAPRKPSSWDPDSALPPM